MNRWNNEAIIQLTDWHRVGEEIMMGYVDYDEVRRLLEADMRLIPVGEPEVVRDVSKRVIMGDDR